MCPVTESSVETACQNGVAKRTSKDSDAHPAKAEGFITVSPILCASGLSLEDATKNDTSFHPTTTPLQQSPEENLIFEAKGEGTAEEKREDTARTPEAPTETPGISMTHASMDLIGEKEEIKPIPPDNLETNELKYLQSEVSSQLQRKVADESQSNFPTVIPEGVYPETKKSLPKMMKEQIMVESETEMYQKVAHTLKDRKENAYDQDKVTVKQDSEMVSKSIELDQKDRRCQEKKTESVENKRIEAALDVWEYSQAKDGSTEPNTSVDVKKPSQCKAETEMHLSKLLAVTQDGGEGTFPVCSRDNENVVDCQNIHHHGYKGHKTKKGCKAKKIALCPPEASVREFSNAYSDISADPLFVSEEAINLQSPTISSVFEEYEASTFIKEKLCKNVRPPKKKTKSKVIKGSGVEESLLAVNDDEAGVRAGGTAVAVSTPIPNHKKNKRGRPKKYTLIETSDVQKNTQTTSEAICRSFQQQDHHLSQLKFVPPLEIKTESERTFQTSKNVKKFKKQHLISSLSVRMAGNNTEQSVDTRIPDPANGVAIPQQVRSEIISISAHVDKGAQIEATEVKEKNREEGLAGLKISEPAKIIRRKRGRPLKKKTLAKMAKNLGFTELQQPGERDELKNDMSPHSSLPQKSHVKKMSKKIKKSLCPPENLRRYSRACKLTPVEKIQSGTKDFLQVQKQTISSSATVLSAQEVSSETKAFEIAGEQARKKRRPPKKKESSKPVKCQDQSQELMSTVQDGAVATAAIPSNKGFFSLQKEIHSDLDKTSVLPMKKNVKKPREQQSTSMISFPQVIESIRKNTDMKIMDTTISPVIPLQDENEFISTLPKEGKGEPCQKRKMKAIKGKITEPISVVGEGMKTGEGLAGLGVIGTVVKFKKKVGRPYKKKTLMKMAKHSGLTEGKGSGDRNASVVEDLKNDMLPPGIHSNLPQRSHVKKTGKKVNKALCPPVNVRRYSRACKLNPIEKTEECLAPEHNPLTLLATSDPTDLLQVQKEPISPSLNVLSVPVVSNETRGGEFVEQKPRKKGRPPKKKIDGAEAIAANPNNPVLLKPNKGNWRKKKVSQQSLNVSQQYFVPSSEIKRDVDGTSIQPMKKNVKKIRKQKLISMISFPEVVESTVNNTNTPTSLVIAPQGAYEIVSTLPQVDKGENCHKKKMKAIKEDTTEPTFVVGEHMETGEVLARPKTVGTVVKFKKKIGRPYKKTALKKTARELLCGEEQISNETDVCAGNQMKNVANNSPLEMSSHPIKVCKIKKETKKVKPASSPPITQLRRYSRECKVPSTDKTGDLSTHNLDQTIFLATPSSRDSPILPKIEASPSPAISVISSETNPCDFNDQKPHRRGRPSLKKKKPQECKSAGQGIQGLMLTVHEDVSLDNPNNSATGLDVLNPNSSISSNPPGHSHFLEKPCKEETGDNKVHKQNILNIAGNSFEQPTTNMFLSQAPFLPAEIQSNSDETFQTSILPMNNQKRHRKEKCDGRINPENVLENAEDSTDRSPNVANNVLISQGRCKTIDAAGEEALTNIKKVNTVKEGRSVVGDHSKGEEVLAILKNAKTFTELKRKRGRPYKKEKLIKMAKELSFTDEQRPDGMESARNELQSHILPQEILSHQGQVCNLKKTRKRVEIPCPPSSVTHLRRYHRACKVTTDYTFEKIKEHLAHNLDWSMVACPSDMLSSFSKMDTKQEFIGSEMVKPLEMDGQVPSQNTANISEMQSPTQEHSKKITLESTPLLNSLEQAEALEGTMPFSTILSSDTGMSPFQETVECNTMDSKKSQKVLPSKKMGRRRRRTWWDERGKAKLLLKKNQDTTLQTSQDEGRPETTTEEKIKDEQTDNSNNMHSLSDTTSMLEQRMIFN
ncbi:hypothetical protein JZ751_000216 [Albula glossodonta]|uniref:Uncharacterized protein n=1 Tax=Albula glossodonta TaxID=121402 RepID=A0A8T2PVS4_9TELE|nr:hypothetical protein JZ751_000216 [Albula glossodonta]